MRFLISRSSDSYRACKLPSPDVQPHELARWDREIMDWVVSADTVEELVQTFLRPDVCLTIKPGLVLNHLELDDISTTTSEECIW